MIYETTETIEDKIDRLYEEKIIKQRKDYRTRKEESVYNKYKNFEPVLIKTQDSIIKDVNNTIPSSLLKTVDEYQKDGKISHKKIRIKKIRKKKIVLTPKTSSKPKKRNLGKKVYLEENGDLIGVIYSLIYNEYNDEVIGYEIKDKNSDAILQLPIDQFIEDKKGLILTPRWYIDAVKTIERIEFKERITPELAYLSSRIKKEEMNSFLNSINPEIIIDINACVKLRETLRHSMMVYEEQKERLNNEILDIIKKRVADGISRHEFSEEIMDKRRRIKILDLLITRCMDLIKRLDNTIIGRLGLEKYDMSVKMMDTKDEADSNYTERSRTSTMEDADETKQYNKSLSLHHKQESLTSMIAELLEDKIVEDIKRQLIKNQLSSYDRVNAYGEMQRQEDDKDAYIRMLENELKQKKETIKHLQEELTKIIE
ncbi:MAG: hypothetical protein QXS02_00765 [Candidatus Thermoplasmatota archaeon]